jgi:hypothetical protein
LRADRANERRGAGAGFQKRTAIEFEFAVVGFFRRHWSHCPLIVEKPGLPSAKNKKAAA